MKSTRSLLGFVLCTTLTVQCAGVHPRPPQTAPTAANTSAILAAAERIPAGSRVNLTLDDGHRLKGVLLAVEGGEVLVRERTRLPEPPLRIDAGRVVFLELDAPRPGIGKMIAIGAAIGAGVTLAFLAILAASLDD